MLQNCSVTYLGRLITLANFPHHLPALPRYSINDEMRLSQHDIAIVLENFAVTDDGDEVLCAPDLALQAFPDLRTREYRRGASGVDLLGVGNVDGDHDGWSIANNLRSNYASG